MSCCCHDEEPKVQSPTKHTHSCCTFSADEEEEENPAELKRRILISAVLLCCAVIIQHTIELSLWVQLLLFLPSYLVVGLPTLKEAAESIVSGHPFDEDFLMSIATLGALLIGFIPGGEPMFAEAVFVMLFFEIGELFEGLAEDRSRRSIEDLMDIRPDLATVERDGHELTVNPQDVALGEIVVVRPGEKLPLDGVVIEGSSSLNTVALTGESKPRDVHEGSDVASGCINLSGVLRIKVTKSFGESTASKILDLVQSASNHKSRTEAFIKNFARHYTPIVVVLALVIAIFGPLTSGSYTQNFATWLLRALTFLVVSCPCALVLSVPLTFFGGIGGASRKGILIKGSNYMDSLARTHSVVFDKTGTLTQGSFSVSATHPSKLSAEDLLHFAAHVEAHSSHPIAAALRDAYPAYDDSCSVSDVQEIAGEGVIAQVNGERIAVGNTRLMERLGISWKHCSDGSDAEGTIVHVAQNGDYAGHIVISDQLKPSSEAAIQELHDAAITSTIMLTGDREEVAASVAQKLQLDEYHSELLPGDKVEQLERIIDQAKKNDPKATVAFVGDGINDAPVLARADVGIAMGALGSDAAIEAADVVLMDDDPTKIAVAIQIARRTLGIASQNIGFAIGVKICILMLAAIGKAPMWLAVFGDVGVMVLCVLNASRALHVHEA